MTKSLDEKYQNLSSMSKRAHKLIINHNIYTKKEQLAAVIGR